VRRRDQGTSYAFDDRPIKKGDAGNGSLRGEPASAIPSRQPKAPRPARPAAARRGRRRDVPNGERPSQTGPRPESERVIVDASNVAHFTESTVRLANVRLVRDRLTEDGLTPILVADAALRHQIDDADAYEGLVKAGEIKQAPAGTDADYFILSFARELDASVLSNDRFKDRIAHFPEVKDRIIRYMIVAGEVVLERRGKRRDR
jgi:Zc3h12a-like Ribonuclease NYN domain